MRIATIVSGFAVLIAGIVMLALPGPGLLMIAAGLAILAREFHWARRLLEKLKNTTAWVGRKMGRGADGANGPESNRSDRD